MPLILWNESLTTEIPLIDEQHKILIDKINTLYDSIVIEAEYPNLEMMLDSLIDYTCFHFDTEERFFDKYRYPEKLKHKTEHIEFKNTINNYFERLLEDKECLALEILNYLNLWLVQHIMHVDKDYVTYLKEKID